MFATQPSADSGEKTGANKNRNEHPLRGSITRTYELLPATLRALVDSHLLRAEPSLQGGYIYELSHDSLVAPVLKAKRRRLEEENLLAAEALLQAELAELRRQAAEERRKRQRTRRLAAAVIIAALISIVAAIMAYSQTVKAQQALQNAHERHASGGHPGRTLCQRAAAHLPRAR